MMNIITKKIRGSSRLVEDGDAAAVSDSSNLETITDGLGGQSTEVQVDVVGEKGYSTVFFHNE